MIHSHDLNTIKKYFPPAFKRRIKRFVYNLYDSYRYYLSEKRAPVSGSYRHIVFICKGNICRSAFAEHYFKAAVQSINVRVESCGLDVDQGRISPPSAIQVARLFGITLENHSSKGLSQVRLKEADLIVLMEYRHFASFKNLYPHFNHKSILIREFLPWPERLFCNLYDPYGLNFAEFTRCFRLIKKAIDRMNIH